MDRRPEIQRPCLGHSRDRLRRLRRAHGVELLAAAGGPLRQPVDAGLGDLLAAGEGLSAWRPSAGGEIPLEVEGPQQLPGPLQPLRLLPDRALVGGDRLVDRTGDGLAPWWPSARRAQAASPAAIGSVWAARVVDIERREEGQGWHAWRRNQRGRLVAANAEARREVRSPDGAPRPPRSERKGSRHPPSAIIPHAPMAGTDSPRSSLSPISCTSRARN